MVFLTVLLVLLQAKLWFGDASVPKIFALRQDVKVQEEQVEKLKLRNQTLEAEVQDLKHRLSAIEERARTDLGMIRKGESFFQYGNKSS